MLFASQVYGEILAAPLDQGAKVVVRKDPLVCGKFRLMILAFSRTLIRRKTTDGSLARTRRGGSM